MLSGSTPLPPAPFFEAEAGVLVDVICTSIGLLQTLQFLCLLILAASLCLLLCIK